MLAKFIYPRRTYERIFAQLVEDMREEIHESLEQHGEKAKWRVRWLKCSYHAWFVVTVVTHTFSSVGKQVTKIWKLIG